MSYASLIKSLSQTINQPTSIAVMASVGLHGLVGVALPYVTSSQEQQQPPQTVQLVELSPSELSRVPDLAPPPSLPPSAFAPTPLTSGFPPLPRTSPPLNTPSKSVSSPINIDLLRQQLAQRQKGKRPSLPIQDAPIRIDPRSRSQTTASRIFQANNPNLRIATPQRTNRIPVFGFPSGSRLPNFPQLPDTNNSTGQPQNNIPIVNQPQDRTPVINQPPTETIAGRLPQDNSPIANQPQGNSPVTNQSPSRDTTTASRPTPTPPETSPIESSSGTRNGAPIREGYDWLARNQVDSRPQELQIAGNYPPQACSPQRQNGSAVVAVKANGDGSVIPRTIQVLSSSGSAFSERAFSIVRGRKFRATGKEQPYMVRVQFEYDSRVCASVREQQAPDKAPEPNSTDRPAPSPTETPKRNSTDRPTQNSTQTPNRNSTDRPAQNSTQTPNRNSTETPEPNSTEQPTQNSTDRPTPSSTETPEPNSTEQPTENSTQTPNRNSTET